MPEGYRLLGAGYYRLLDGAGPYAWDGTAFALMGSGRGSVAVVGGGVLLEGETNGFAVDFTHTVDAERVAVKTAGTVVSSALDTFFTNAGTSPKQVYDVAGVLGWSPHNLCLQSENLAASWVLTGVTAASATFAQTTATFASHRVSLAISVIAGEAYTYSVVASANPAGAGYHILGIYPVNTPAGEVAIDLTTGTIVYQNTPTWTVSVSPLGGGQYRITASMPSMSSSGVQLFILPNTYTTGSVTGSWTPDGIGGINIHSQQYNRGPTATAYLKTTTAARYGLAVDYDPVTHAAKGLLCEPAATNLLLNSTTLSTQSVTVTAVTHTLSFWGTGTITNSGVSTTVLVGTGVNDRVQVSFLPTAGSLTLTVTGTVSRAQLEIGTVATSPIPTFAATATRAVDLYSVTPASINYSATAGSWWADLSFRPFGTAQSRAIAYATSYSPMYQNTATAFALFETLALNKVVPSTAGAHKLASAFTTGDRAITADGLTAAVDAGGVTNLLAPGALIYMGGNLTTNSLNNYIRKLYYVPRRMTNTELEIKTAIA